MKALHLGLALHNHQPVGNFEWVFEKAYRQAYLPMLEALERHPRVRLALHYSGCLLDWIEANRPEFIARLASLASRGQVELMTGGYYEPVLPSIPDADKLGQIDKLTTYIRRRLGYEPTGLWLAERVWEPHLPRILQQAGVRWTVLDDNHFKRTGLTDDHLFGYYITEEQGATISLFGTSQQLRYTIPWRSVGEVMQYLRSVAAEEPRIAVMGDDGEKFGIWPQTDEKCWAQGWVDELFTAFEDNADWLHMVPPGQFAQQYSPVGRIYLPTSSYVEMSEWALPAQQSYEFSQVAHRLEAEGQQDATRFLSGGFWRHFMVKYPEVNQMHKKMLRVHQKVQVARAKGATQDGQQQLWEGQCNCAYWHGVFGGTYLSHIRSAVFERLIASETEAEAALYGQKDYLRAERTDYDCDGAEELVLDGRHLSLSLSPSQGGGILEWDLRHPAYNLTNVLTRRPEGYHWQLVEAERNRADLQVASGVAANIHEVVRVKEQGLSQRLVYDRYNRLSMLDHILEPSATVQQFALASRVELGDFVDKPYSSAVEHHGDTLHIVLTRHSSVPTDGRMAPIRVEKQLRLYSGRAALEVQYNALNLGEWEVQGRFGSEWNLNLLGGSDGRRAFVLADGRPVGGWTLEAVLDFDAEDLLLGNPDLGWQLQVRFSPGARVWICPLEAVSNSEAGFERTYQGTTLLFHWPLALAPGGLLQERLSWTAEKIG